MEEINILRKANVKLENGLTNKELLAIEHSFQIQFPPDLKELLQVALPVSEGFPNWRKAITNLNEFEANEIKKRLAEPLDGLLFDIEHNNIWYAPWGIKPKSLQEKIKVAKIHFNKYPVLIPVFKHRFIPSMPMLKGNPVFSLWQTDIIYYGVDLCHYFINEFSKVTNSDKKPRDILFWQHWANSSSCW